MNDKTIALPNGYCLSAIARGDQAALAEHLREPDLHLYTDHLPLTAAEAEWWVNFRAGTGHSGAPETLLALRRPEGTLIGAIGVGDGEVGPAAVGELGYWLAKPEWGQGLMTAAVATFCRYAFEALALHKLEAKVFDPNIGSWRVLEKCGFKLEGYIREHAYRRGAFLDDREYGLLRSEWEAGR
jgi:[ribosomal protein S5]-alanine N-acetyltransferase